VARVTRKILQLRSLALSRLPTLNLPKSLGAYYEGIYAALGSDVQSDRHRGKLFSATSKFARRVPTSISLLLPLSFSARARFLERSKQCRKQDSIIFRLIRSRFLCVRERERERERERGRQTIYSADRVLPFSAISLTSLVTADNIV